MTDTRLTRPERFAELKAGRRDVARMLRKHGTPCFLCIHRGEEGWDHAVCKVSGRAFPMCMKDKLEPAFEADEARLEEFRRANRIEPEGGTPT